MRYSAHARLSRVSPRRTRGLCLHVCPPPVPQVVAPASHLWAGHRPGPPPGHPCPGTPRHPRGPIRRGGVLGTRMCETTHPAGEHGFEAGGYSGRGHSFTAGPKGLTHVRYTPPASAQPSPLKGADMRGGRGKRGGPGPQPGARRPNLAASHCDNRRTQSGCARTLLMCGVPTEAWRTMLATAEPRLAKIHPPVCQEKPVCSGSGQ